MASREPLPFSTLPGINVTTSNGVPVSPAPSRIHRHPNMDQPHYTAFQPPRRYTDRLQAEDGGLDSGFQSAATSRRTSVDLQEKKPNLEDLERGNSPAPAEPIATPSKPSLRERLHHFTWAWYTLTMSTGGISTLCSVQPHTFHGLFGIGEALFILNIVLFTLVSTAMTLRFLLHGGTFTRSLTHARESLFFPTFWLSIATLINCFHKYWIAPLSEDSPSHAPLVRFITAAFWIYFVLTFLVALIQYEFLFACRTYQLQSMMPAWLLPVFPVMLAGTVASVIADELSVHSRMPVLVAGLAAQGLGFIVAVFMYAHYIGRLMQSGLPCREHRPGMFIAVGPPSFTALALLGMASSLPDKLTLGLGHLADLQDDSAIIPSAAIQAVSLVAAIFLWLLATWFLLVAVLSVALAPPKHFHLSWWAMVFPNSGYVIATISIGDAVRSAGVAWLGTALSIVLVAVWLFVLCSHALAVWKGAICWPGKDEDTDD